MNPILKNILAVIAGIVLASVVNMGLIKISGSVIPPPTGADITTEEGIKASMHLMELRHFIFPVLAHALGTLVGAFIAALIAANHKMKFAMSIGVLYLIGGITMCFLVPAPAWFIILDLVGAYIPMAWIGGKLALKKLRVIPKHLL